MDLSQLCSTSSNDPTCIPPLTNRRVESTDQTRKIRPSSLDFILSPYKESESNNEPPTSTELVFDQCSKLCESIWQLKLQHKTLTIEDRETMIDNLSKSAQSLFQTIRCSDDWVSKENCKKRECVYSPVSRSYEEDEDDDDDDDDEDDQDEEYSTAQTGAENMNYKDHAEYELIRQARNLQDAQSKPNYRRRNRRSMAGMKCHSCGTSSTPEWRRGPDGARTLCNACGLHYSKLLKKGSIGVQTNNYLLTGGLQPQSPSIVSATAISNNVGLNGSSITISSSSSSAAPNALVNFPFVLMDPKYGVEKRLKAPKQLDNPTNRNSIGSNSTATTSSSSGISTLSNSASPLQQSPYTQQMPPFAKPTIDNCNANQNSISQQQQQQFVNISSPQLPLPSLSQQDLLSSSSNKRPTYNSTSSSQNSITPLRIHQWKNH